MRAAATRRACRAGRAPARRHTATGSALLDVLVALLVLSLMATSLLQAEAQLRRLAEVARRRGEATQIAQQALEHLREPAPAANAGAGVPPPPAAAGYVVTAASAPASGAIDAAPWRELGVQVRWADPGGTARHLQLATRAPPPEALHDAAAALAPQDEVIARPFARSTGVPATARPYREGRSLWRPAPTGDVSWLVDDASGMVTARCGNASADPRCEPMLGRAVSGHVRFSLDVPPKAEGPADPPRDLALALELDLRAGETAECVASAAGLGAEQLVRYGCVVGGVPPEGWSGRLVIVPRGWRLGAQASDHRICRYSADLDHSGAIDRNEEHPARYHAVRGTLSQQNFLVIRGDQRCSEATTHNGAPPELAAHQP